MGEWRDECTSKGSLGSFVQSNLLLQARRHYKDITSMQSRVKSLVERSGNWVREPLDVSCKIYSRSIVEA